MDYDRDMESEEREQLASAVRDMCVDAALQAYEDAGFAGLCAEGRWEAAVDALRALDLREVLEGSSGGSARAAAGSADRPRAR